MSVASWARALELPADTGGQPSCPMVRIVAERLADLNIPRNAHAAFCVNGEVTVVGGHTTSFVPTATAEYYRDGRWHLMETAYPHDNGICVVLSSGKVLLGGGHSEPLGVGRSFPVELYDPATHTFRGFSCLDAKRTLAGGVELDSGRVVVAGNWYGDDGIELFDGDRTFHRVKDVSEHRASPYILRTARDNALILGSGGTHGEMLFSDVVDQLRGDPLHVPLLRQWQPLFYEAPFCCDTGFIGDEAADDYSWLLPVQDWSVGDSTAWLASRPLAFLLVRDTLFSLLPTACAVPVQSPFGDIRYNSPVIADRQARRAYMHGIDNANRHYVLCVEYDKRPAPLTLYYTDPLPEAGFPEIVLTDDGDLMIVGGHNYNASIGGTLGEDNFSPLSSVFLLRLCRSIDGQRGADNTASAWLWVLPVVVLIAIAVVLLLKRRRQATAAPDEPCVDVPSAAPDEPCVDEPSAAPDEPCVDEPSAVEPAMMSRIRSLMEQQQLYLNSDLKLGDVAALLGTNRNIVSAAINQTDGYSFSQFVGGYRVRHAQQLMASQPDMKMTEVWLSSGFATESSFFRAFKAVTGMTPNEWKSRQ